MDNAIEAFTGDQPSVRQSQLSFPTRDVEMMQNYDGLIEIVCAYRREVDTNGVPVMSMTCFTERVKILYDPSGYQNTSALPFMLLEKESVKGYLILGLAELLVDASMVSRRS